MEKVSLCMNAFDNTNQAANLWEKKKGNKEVNDGQS